MTDRHDAEYLADSLDRHLPPDSDRVSPQLPDDPAVRAASRLATGPKPMLDPAARARMKAQVMAAVPTIVPGGPPPVIRYIVFALASAAVTVIALFGLFNALNISGAGATPTPAAVALVTETGTTTDMPPTATDEPTATQVPPTLTLVGGQTQALSETPAAPSSTPVRPSATPLTPTLTATTPHTATSPPTIVARSTEVAARLTIEGVIEAIDGRVLTISGLEVELTEDDPLLEVLRVDDRVRIEGELVRGVHLFTVEVQTFELANPDDADNQVEESPDGSVWRDPGNCDNPPPPWAKANGWRARCEGAESPGNSGGSGNNSGGGQGNPNRPQNPGPPGSPGNSGNPGRPGN